MHLLFTQDVANFAGQHYTLTDAWCAPKPVQQPRPPFVLGGQGEKRMLPIVARWADQWNFPGITAADLAPKLEVLHRCCAEIGRDPGTATRSLLLGFGAVLPTASVAAYEEAAERAGALGFDELVVYGPHASGGERFRSDPAVHEQAVSRIRR